MVKRATTVIGVTNNKGGTGKTAVAMNIAYLCAEEAETLLMDLDNLQANAFEYSTKGSEDLESGIILPSKYDYDAVWIENIAKEVPATSVLKKYEFLVLDGRPEERVNQFILENSDIIFLPFVTQQDLRMAKLYRKRIPSNVLSFALRNKTENGKRGIPRDDALFHKTNPRLTAKYFAEVFREVVRAR